MVALLAGVRATYSTSKIRVHSILSLRPWVIMSKEQTNKRKKNPRLLVYQKSAHHAAGLFIINNKTIFLFRNVAPVRAVGLYLCVRETETDSIQHTTNIRELNHIPTVNVSVSYLFVYI